MYSPDATVGFAVLMAPMGGRALAARFTITCSICPRSALTRARRGSRTTPKSMSAPMRRSSIGSMSPRMALRFKDPGRQDLQAAEGQDLAGQRRPSRARLENLLEVLAKEKGNNDVPVVPRCAPWHFLKGLRPGQEAAW